MLLESGVRWTKVRWRCPLCVGPAGGFGLSFTGPTGSTTDRAIATVEDHYREHHADAAIPEVVNLTVSRHEA